MKLTLIIGAAIAAVGVAACGSSPAGPTARPATPTPTVTAAPTATPTLTPTSPPTPSTPSVDVTVTCSNVPQMWAHPYPRGSILGIATWHNLTIGDYFGVGLLTTLVTSHTMSVGVVGFWECDQRFHAGDLGVV